MYSNICVCCCVAVDLKVDKTALYCLCLMFFYKFLLCCIYAGGINHEPDIRLSVKGMNCDETKETSAYIFIPYEKSIIRVC